MLELFTTSIFEFLNILFKVSETKPRYKKSARGAIRIHWLLSKMIEHSETFIQSLEIMLEENRIPTRLYVAIRALRDDVKELKDMIEEDKFGFYVHFWEVISIYDSSVREEIDGVLGNKLQRLEVWEKLLEGVSGKLGHDGKWLLITDKFSPPPYDHYIYDSYQNNKRELPKDNYTVLKLLEKNCFREVIILDGEILKQEIENSQKTLANLKVAQLKWSRFIKENYKLEDLF